MVMRMGPRRQCKVQNDVFDEAAMVHSGKRERMSLVCHKLTYRFVQRQTPRTRLTGSEVVQRSWVWSQRVNKIKVLLTLGTSLRIWDPFKSERPF